MTDQPIRITNDDRHDSLRLIPWWDQRRLAEARVLVVGAGALGNEALKNLALLGVGRIGVVDMDHVEHSNLSRSVLYRAEDADQPKASIAARRAREIDPRIDVVPLQENVMYGVGLGWFADADVVLGCLDNREARLWVNRCCWHVGTPWIDAGIQEISGVVQVFRPPHGTCYECGMKESDYRLINLRYSCPLLQEDDIRRGRVPTTPTIASMMAGWQVQELLKLLHGLPAAESTALVFHGMTNHVYRTKLPRRDDCLSHDPWGEAIPLTEIDTRHTLAEFRAAAERACDGEVRVVHLTRDLVSALRCQQCGHEQRQPRLRGQTRSSEANCPECREQMQPELTASVHAEEDPLWQLSLAELGIPAADVLITELADRRQAFRIAGTTFPGSPHAGMIAEPLPRGRHDDGRPAHHSGDIS